MSSEERGKYLQNDESFASRAIHAGHNSSSCPNSQMIPSICLSTNFREEVPPHHKGYIYTRLSNPVRDSLETCLASLEETKYCAVMASGMAAACVILQLLGPGDHVVTDHNLYYGVHDRFKHLMKTADVDFLDSSDLSAIGRTLRPTTKMVWIESPSNPMMKLVDIKGLVSLVKNKSPSAILVCDNTFMTPYFQRPSTLGIDIVMHSCSKYIGGHSDVLMGAVCTDRQDLFSDIQAVQKTQGAVPSPFECFLVLRSLKTLSLRMEKHMSNALAVARFLENHPMVEKVLHPGLTSHPQHELALRQTFGHSGIFSVYLKKDDLESTAKILANFRLVQIADSLGGCESIIKMPSQMPPGAFTKKDMEFLEINDGFLRISIGLEAEKDLISDFEQAFKSAQE